MTAPAVLNPSSVIRNLSANRVIFVNRVYWPSQAATAQLLADLAEELAARGWEVHVVAAGDENSRRHGVSLHRTGPGETHGGLVSRARNYAAFLLGARRVLRDLVRPGDTVVVLTDPPLLAAAATGPALAHGASVVHWIQDIYPEIIPAHTGGWSAPLLAPLRWVRNRAWRSARGCVPVSADMAATVAAQGVPASAISVVHNWAPPELKTPAAAAAIAAQRAAWDAADKFIVAYSGNLGRVHEFATVLAAAALLRDEPDIVFLFVGGGARFAEVAAAAAARRLTNVRFLPATPRAQLAAALAAADAHLVTLRPGFEHLVSPSKLAGILAAGRPALYVGPAGTEISRLLAVGPCGATVAPGDSARLAAAVRQWRDDPGARAAAGRAARRCFEQHFTLAQSADRWEHILRPGAA
ncbi:MAG: glycosyltransferase family 4 protein [Opitutae bacterium]|nr:glycosyltransferase family 4 protein [Opitutae bacterium]